MRDVVGFAKGFQAVKEMGDCERQVEITVRA